MGLAPSTPEVEVVFTPRRAPGLSSWPDQTAPPSLCDLAILELHRLGKLGDVNLENAPTRFAQQLLTSLGQNGALNLAVLRQFQRTSVYSISLSNSYPVNDEWLEPLANFPSLISLDLSHCSSLTNSGIQQLSVLSSLRSLNLTKCYSITGQGLLGLYRLIDLTVLNLSECRGIGDTKRGAICPCPLDGLKGMRKMQILTIAKCPLITDDAIQVLGAMKSLRQLSLAHCFRITQRGMTGLFESWPQLTHLDLTSTQANWTILKETKSLLVLRSLGLADLANCDINDDALEILSSLPGLSSLDISNTKISDLGGARHISRFQTLKWLNLASSGAGDFTVEHLFRLSNLETLDISDTEVSNAGLVGISKLYKLQTLNVAHSKVTCKGMRHLTSLERLTYLNLDSHGILDQGVATVAHLESLCQLNLFGATITDAAIFSLGGLTNLQSLEACGGYITDLAIESILKMTKLKNLNLSQNSGITDKGAVKLAAIRSLLALNLSHTKVSAKSIDVLAQLPLLRMLSVGGTRTRAQPLEGNPRLIIWGDKLAEQ